MTKAKTPFFVVARLSRNLRDRMMSQGLSASVCASTGEFDGSFRF